MNLKSGKHCRKVQQKCALKYMQESFSPLCTFNLVPLVSESLLKRIDSEPSDKNDGRVICLV